MVRRLPHALWFAGVTFALVAGVKPATAAGKDAAALKLEKDAIYNDYLATKFGDAEKKLKQALAMCKGNACSPSVVASLHRDLAIVYMVGMKKQDEAKKEFGLAVQTDPSVTLVKDLSTPEIEQAFEAAKSGGGAAADDEVEEQPKPGKGRKRPAAGGNGEVLHAVPPEQATLTPVPLYAEMPDGVNVTKVHVRYKPFGGEWKSVEMKRWKEGWAGEIPCLDVGTATGDLKYIIQGVDENGEVVAHSGTKQTPNTVVIKNELAGDAPHLPGKPAPAQCANAADCPPGLPGCKAEKSKRHGNKGRGDMCEDSSECEEGLACKVGACAVDETANSDAGRPCQTSDECSGSQVCTDGFCSAPAQEPKRNWVSLAFQMDMLMVPKSDDACGPDSGNSYTCIDAGQIAPTENLDTNSGNQVKSGGIARSTMRILVGYDRLFGRNFLIGARVGFAFGGAPGGVEGSKALFPLHLEARGSYFFGSDPFGRKGFRPYVLAAAGAAGMDASVPVTLYYTDGGEEGRRVDAWHKTGNAFASLGLGTQYAFGIGSALFLEAKGNLLFGSSGTAISLQLGYAYGL